MSEHITFSASVKQELCLQLTKKKECMLAELSVYIAYFGRIINTSHGVRIYLETENEYVSKRYASLLKHCFKISPELGFMRFKSAEHQKNSSFLYCIAVKNSKDAAIIYYMLRNVPTDEFGRVLSPFIHKDLLTDEKSKRAFIRGAFVSAGTISNPNKSYHYEIYTIHKELAELILYIINEFVSSAKLIGRKKGFVVYIKDADKISDLLALMDAHSSKMEFENARIMHYIANQINRQTNCEVANSQKTISASSRQIDDIMFIKKCGEFHTLPDSISELALLRLEYDNVPLKQLGEIMNPPISKSCVNHRMRKLSEIAENLRLKYKDITK